MSVWSRVRHPGVPQLRAVNPVPGGAAFVAVLLVLVYLAFNVQSLPFIGGGPTYSAAFPEVAGLHKGDRVRIAGIDVGLVKGITLDGQHVKVTFTVKGAHLGQDVRADIEIFTLLGNKYLALQPGKVGTWPRKREIPLDRTSAPYDVTEAFQDVSNTVGRIDVKQLAKSFDTIATTFRDSPPAVRSMLNGLSRLSQTVASRDQELTNLLQSASGVTGVLAQRREQLVTLFGDGSKLLSMIRDREQVIAALLTHSKQLADQLAGLVHDNEQRIQPLLDHLHNVVSILENGQTQLQESIQRLFVWTRRNIETIGAGPWFDGEVVNFTNPFQGPGDIFNAKPRKPANGPARNFADLLGVPRGAQ
jgi:phospholipid/cholesterol/gamma-HCH transport system substrate-binding protein